MLFYRKIALLLILGGISEAKVEHCEEDSCGQDSSQWWEMKFSVGNSAIKCLSFLQAEL